MTKQSFRRKPSPAQISAEVEAENIEFLMSPMGGSLTVEAVAVRLGVDKDAMVKRMERRARLARAR